MSYTAYCDGSCRPNPGIMAIGAVIYKDDKEIHTVSEIIGEGTSNVAEYSALIEVLRWLVMNTEQRGEELLIRMDSQLVVRQITGEYGVTNKRMIPLHAMVMNMIEFFNWKIEHVPREQNTRADELANAAYE